METTSRIASKGQATIPEAVRGARVLGEGDEIVFLDRSIDRVASVTRRKP